MSVEPLGIERRVVRVEIVKRRPSKYTVIGFGPGRTRVHAERGADKVIIHSGATTEISGIKEVIIVKTLMNRLWLRAEILPETGAKIVHITGG